MDSSRWGEAGATGARPPAHRVLWPQARQAHSSRPGPVHRRCLFWKLNCSCHIQCVTQNCSWAAPLLAGQEPSVIHEILLAVDSTHRVSPCRNPKAAMAVDFVDCFFLALISHVATPCQAWAWSRE